MKSPRPRWRARALGVSGLRIAIGCHTGRDRVAIVRPSGRPVADDERLTLAMTDFLATRARRLQLSRVAAAAVAGDLQVRDAVLAWVRARPLLASAAFAVAGAPRWSRTDQAAAGCVAPAQ